MTHTGPKLRGLELRQHIVPVARDLSEGAQDILSIGERILVFPGGPPVS